MSDDYGCLACEGKNPVNWLLTRLNPATTFSVCEHDIEQAMVALLATRMEVDAGWLTEAINAAVDQVNAELAESQETVPDGQDPADTHPGDHDEQYPVVLDD